jgi:uncharacterized protein
LNLSAPSNTDSVDRVAPSLRPTGRCVMHQRWAQLLFLHWAVPAEVLQERLPAGLELDTFDGKAFVGLVPFTMTGVRPRGCPAVPGLSNFHEVNVRTYVHVGGRDPGVWFFSLDAANRLAVKLARMRFHLPYHYARIRLTEERMAGDSAHEIEYRSERVPPRLTHARRVRCALRYRPTGAARPALPGTLEHFLVERYILYSYDGRRLFRGRVHHTHYPVQSAELLSLEENLVAAAGITPPAITPLVHYASEVLTEVFALEPVAP